MDQFREPLAPTVAVAVVDPPECCASSDAPTVPDAVWLPAVTVGFTLVASPADAPGAAVVGAVVLGDLAALADADAGAAMADFAGTFAAVVDSVPFSDFEASAAVATLAAEELAAEDAVFSAELATLLVS